MGFAFPIKLSLCQPMSFPAFLLPIVSPILLVGKLSERLDGTWLLAGVKTRQDRRGTADYKGTLLSRGDEDYLDYTVGRAMPQHLLI